MLSKQDIELINMNPIASPEHGKVSMDQRVRYNNSIKGFANEKRHLRMSDEEEIRMIAKRRERLKKLRELQNKS